MTQRLQVSRLPLEPCPVLLNTNKLVLVQAFLLGEQALLPLLQAGTRIQILQVRGVQVPADQVQRQDQTGTQILGPMDQIRSHRFRGKFLDPKSFHRAEISNSIYCGWAIFLYWASASFGKVCIRVIPVTGRASSLPSPLNTCLPRLSNHYIYRRYQVAVGHINKYLYKTCQYCPSIKVKVNGSNYPNTESPKPILFNRAIHFVSLYFSIS